MFDKQRVLDLVNLARAATGLPQLEALPKGTKQQPSDCPIARAVNFSAEVTAMRIKFPFGREQDGLKLAQRVRSAWGPYYTDEAENNALDAEEPEVLLPYELQYFIHDFDHGHAEEFEEPVLEA